MWVELELRVGGDGLAFAEMRLHGGLDGALCGRGRRSVWVEMAWCVGRDGTAFSWKWHGSWVEMVRFVGVEMAWLVIALRRGVRSRWRGLWTEIELCVGGYDSPWPN